MTLTEFLLARIAEDEEMAWRAGPTTDEAPGTDGLYWVPGDDGVERITVDPVRVLAVCEAHRRIVDWAAPVLTNWPNAPEDFRYVSDDGLDVLKIVALPYAEHPDFREEWRL